MSGLGVGAAHLPRSIGSANELKGQTDLARMAKEALPAVRATVAATNSPSSHLAVAAEELTFQFSETVEAKESSLEERLKRQQRATEKAASLKVEHIQAIIKLMEGKEGYEVLRGQARSFAALYQTNAEAALKHIDLESMSAEKKYALLHLAVNTLGQNPSSRDAQNKLNEYIQQQNNPFRHPEHANIIQAVNSNHQPRQHQDNSLPIAISIQPSIKGLWDVISEKSDGNLMAAIRARRSEWLGDQTFPLESMGALLIVHKIVTIIQSMHTHADQIMKKMGIQDTRQGDLLQKQTKMLIDLAQSSMPSALIDRLVDNLKSNKRRCPRCSAMKRMVCKTCKGNSLACNCKVDMVCQCIDVRGYILSLLHWHARQWPMDVWINDDAKNMLLEQLLKKQNAPTGLVAKRMMP